MKIKVDMEADYGEDCSFGSYGSEETIELDVTSEVLDCLKSINPTEVTNEEVASAIAEGKAELTGLNDEITEAFYKMVEHYWLVEANESYEEDYLKEGLKEDLESGDFVPSYSMEEFLKDHPVGNSYFYGKGDDEIRYLDSLYDEYRKWFYQQDNDFIAERFEFDLDSCRDFDVTYTIRY